jgi:tetratricopeptide (TPR) repeat protein
MPGSAARVSVIVRSMARPSLAAALDSLAAQADIELEVVVVAACGPGHPPVTGTCGAHPVRVVGGEHSLQRAAAANAGLDAARGDWITFLDDDDRFEPGHVAGLLAALTARPACEAVYSYARMVLADGSQRRFGQPYSLMQLYERNYIHLSTALFARTLCDAGCRFDESLEIHEDWDFFLQIAQHTTPVFAPVESFRWHADAGSSGAGGGDNHDASRFARYRDQLYAKWRLPHEALVERVTPLLHEAAGRVQGGDPAGATSLVQQALQVSPNDPHALNLLAMIQRRQGLLAQALATQELAVAVRPHDPAMVYNLALVAMASRDVDLARRCCDRALSLEPAYPPAERLRRQLAVVANA